MMSNLIAKSFWNVEYSMFNNIQTLANKNSCLTTALSRVAILGASVVNLTLSISVPILNLIEKLAFALINFLGERIGFKECNSEDGWKSLKKAVPWNEIWTELPSYYLGCLIYAFIATYSNLKNPPNALPIFLTVNSYFKIADLINHQKLDLEN